MSLRQIGSVNAMKAQRGPCGFLKGVGRLPPSYVLVCILGVKIRRRLQDIIISKGGSGARVGMV